ncbi:TetR/AcrR family transcriptional regulator [Aliisedimentitalea scapharcae]|uniref:TetR/AcrR family transcriptional regulator n=1 Tax=Aliisedimentitalea scapharcae TaxID=1524259 RepID=A0ABZ2XQF4_9RHOB
MLETLSTSKSEILDAAAWCFMTQGCDSASIDDIAGHLGSTKGRIYHHFPSKGALLSAVQLRAARFTYRAVAPVVDLDLSPDRCLHQMSRTHVQEVLRTLPYHKVVLQSFSAVDPKSPIAFEQDLRTQLRKEQRYYAGLFLDVIKRGQTDGCFTMGGDPRVAMASVLTLLNAPLFWYQPRQDNSKRFDTALAGQLAAMAVASLKHPSDGAL